MQDNIMRSEQEIKDRLHELDRQYLPKEMGGLTPYGEAKALLWALGYDDPTPSSGVGVPDRIDVSEYLNKKPDGG